MIFRLCLDHRFILQIKKYDHSQKLANSQRCQNRPDFGRALDRFIRGLLFMSFLAKVSPIHLLRRAFTRVINIESIPAFDKYDHLSNMESKDLFQFEPFSGEDHIVAVCGGD